MPRRQNNMEVEPVSKVAGPRFPGLVPLCGLQLFRAPLALLFCSFPTSTPSATAASSAGQLEVVAAVRHSAEPS
jgi:hypothetical protein